MKPNEKKFWLVAIITVIVSLGGLISFLFLIENKSEVGLSMGAIGLAAYAFPTLVSLFFMLSGMTIETWKGKDGLTGLVIGGYPAVLVLVILILYGIFFKTNPEAIFPFS